MAFFPVSCDCMLGIYRPKRSIQSLETRLKALDDPMLWRPPAPVIGRPRDDADWYIKTGAAIVDPRVWSRNITVPTIKIILEDRRKHRTEVMPVIYLLEWVRAVRPVFDNESSLFTKEEKQELLTTYGSVKLIEMVHRYYPAIPPLHAMREFESFVSRE